MRDDDRSTILRRRAFFVTSAVAALGACARTPPAQPEPGPPATVSVPSAEPDSGEPVEDAAIVERDASASTSDTGAPPLIVPAGVSDTARAKYERLIQTMTRAYALLDEVEARIPGCSILRPKCEPSYRRIAEKLHDLDGMFRRMFVCSGSSPEAKAYGELEQAHERHYQKRRGDIQRRIDELLEKDGDPARVRWEKAQQDAFQAAPHPCLKFGCPDW